MKEHHPNFERAVREGRTVPWHRKKIGLGVERCPRGYVIHRPNGWIKVDGKFYDGVLHKPIR